MTISSESRTALGELISLLQEVDQRWSSPEWNLHSSEDISASHRALMHMLETGLVTQFEQHPAFPQFRRIVTPSRKVSGDNSDAIYFDTAIDPSRSYRIMGEMNGAVYFSLTLEEGGADGGMATNTAGVINNRDIDISADGRFEFWLGGEQRARNWLPLTPDTARVTTRHYFEEGDSAAKDPWKEPRLFIECLDPPKEQPSFGDNEVAEGMRRVANFVRSRTLNMPPMAQAVQPPFVGLTPNEFPTPIPPGDFGLAAFDAHYSMAPYFLGEDEALVVRGRWPECDFANVCLWNRFQQTYDYVNRRASLNRTQTKLEEDGSFQMVIAHRDPGFGNWLDTEGQALGLVFWRYFLVEGEVVTPTAEVIKL